DTRFSTTPTAPSSSWWPMRTTVRRKFGSQSEGEAMSRVPPSRSTRPSSPILLLASGSDVAHPWPSMTGTRTKPDPQLARRRAAGTALTLLFSTALVFAAASPAVAQEAAIRSYDVHIQVQTDGSLLVTERIAYNFGPTE